MITAQVIYATITGNNEDIADIITERFEDQGVEVNQTEISQADASAFLDCDICVVCPYTYDEGALPEEGLDFFDDLQELNLSGKLYGVAGSGDTYYEEYFNVAVDKFDQAFQKAGATKATESIKINLEPDQVDIEALDEFTDDLILAAQKQAAE